MNDFLVKNKTELCDRIVFAAVSNCSDSCINEVFIIFGVFFPIFKDFVIKIHVSYFDNSNNKGYDLKFGYFFLSFEIHKCKYF